MNWIGIKIRIGIEKGIGIQIGIDKERYTHQFRDRDVYY